MTSAFLPVLLVGSALRTSLEQMYLRAFQAIGINEVELLDMESGRPSLLRNRVVNRLLPDTGHAWAGQRLLAYLRNSGKRYRRIIIFKGMQFSRRALEECRKFAPAALWVNINPDDPYNLVSRAVSNANVIESLSFFDAYCIWSRSIADKLRADGHKKVVYLPFGYDTTYHVPNGQTSQAAPASISFIGTWDRERETVLATLAGYNVRIYGSNWKRAARTFPLRSGLAHRVVFGQEIASITASSAICLNLLRPQNRGSHNMRTFEIPAMGGLTLTNRTEEQQEFFPEGDACYMYEGVTELKEKIEHILVNKPEAELIRAKGMELVEAHSYTNRVRFLLNELAH